MERVILVMIPMETLIMIKRSWISSSNPLIAQDVPLVALNLISQRGGSVSGDGIYPLRSIVKIEATPDPDYAFIGWNGDIFSSKNPLQIRMDKSKTVRASFVDSMVDNDQDGLSNLSERIIHKTDPNKPDSDGDGLTDGEEVLVTLSDPNKQDTDNDGLIDSVETGTMNYISSQDTGTNPNDPDTDGDGLSDGCEVKGFTFYSIVKGSYRWSEAVDDAEERAIGNF